MTFNFADTFIQSNLPSYNVNTATGSNSAWSVFLKDTSSRMGIQPPTPWLKDRPANHWPTVAHSTFMAVQNLHVSLVPNNKLLFKKQPLFPISCSAHCVCSCMPSPVRINTHLETHAHTHTHIPLVLTRPYKCWVLSTHTHTYEYTNTHTHRHTHTHKQSCCHSALSLIWGPRHEEETISLHIYKCGKPIEIMNHFCLIN